MARDAGIVDLHDRYIALGGLHTAASNDNARGVDLIAQASRWGSSYHEHTAMEADLSRCSRFRRRNITLGWLICYGYRRCLWYWLYWLGLGSIHSSLVPISAQNSTDIVSLEHFEPVANHAGLQDGIRVGIDRILDGEALHGTKVDQATAQHDIYIFVSFTRG